MFEWFSRYRQRQRDLAAGIDADLVQSNRKRYKFALWLLAVGVVLVIIDSEGKLRGMSHDIVIALCGLSFAGSIFVGRWAMAEGGFLHKPDPKKPPSLFK